MHHVLFAPFAEFVEFQALLERFLVFVAVISDAFAIGTLQFDQVVLWHKRGYLLGGS